MEEGLFFFEAENAPPVRDDAIEVAQRDNDVAVRTRPCARRTKIVPRVRSRRKASVRLLRGLVSAHSSAAPPPVA